jgi:hypothetical protein
VPDLYELQSQAMARMATILDDPSYGRTPPRPAGDPANHRVFEHERAQPPKMWSTHPSNRAREDHAKARYVAREVDERPAWVVFGDPPALRRRVTTLVFELLEVELDKLQRLDDHEAHALIERRYDRHYLDPRFRGIYLARSCVREAEQVAELFDAEPANHDFGALYPVTLRDELARWKDLMSERVLLEGLRDGRLTTPDGVIRHRGQPIRAREIPRVLTTLGDECDEARRRLAAHDRACRTLHAAAARWLGEDWAHYHLAMVTLLHYADHSEANLRDAHHHLDNVLEIVTADDRVTDDERHRILASASDLHITLRKIHRHIDKVVLPEPVARQLGKASWAQMFDERYTNPAPSLENLHEWLPAVAGWFDVTASALDKLERASLQHLLELEALLEACVREHRHPGPPPEAARTPKKYRVLPPGRERKRQTKLDLWERFYLAQGWGPATLRTVAALAIVLGVIYGSFVTGR